MARCVRGKTIGIIGLGNLGQPMAQIAQAFGMRVIAWSPNLTPERAAAVGAECVSKDARSEEHTSELQSLMRISYAVVCLKKKRKKKTKTTASHINTEYT